MPPYATNMAEEPKTKTPEQAADELLESNVVRQWTKRIVDAKKFFEKDFKRMKENREFAAGIQRASQEGIESTEVVTNFINKEVNQKVSTLYAKNPKAIAVRRPRLDYAIWDGNIESMQQAYMVQTQAVVTGMLTPQAMQAQQLLADIAAGKQLQAQIKKVCDTLEVLYQYECDTQAPSFKFQMKQLVRRAVIAGVSYVRLNFSRTGDSVLTASGTDDSFSMRVKRAKNILAQIDEDKVTDDDPRNEQLSQLFGSIQASQQNGDLTNIEERLEFDFPSASSIIVDPKCRSLKGFIGASWIAQQYIMPLQEANAYFETDIKAGGELIEYKENGIEHFKNEPGGNQKDPQQKPLGCFWEVFDITTKSSFFICHGWKKFVQPPAPLEPAINRFWPIFSLTFNDIEVEAGDKCTIYPPSDVDLLKSTQKEWNRIGEELSKNRKRNRPFYLTSEGWLADPDIEKLGEHETCELIRVKGIPPNGSIKDNLVKFESGQIDPGLYNRQNLEQDAAMVTGSQQSQPQPQRHVAATPAVIQEQQRIGGVSSNVDDLDDLLSELGQAGGEIMLREFSPQTVQRIVGRGAAWPTQQRQDFLNEIYLEVESASSGRPNKAVDVSTAQTLGPLMQQAGANPWALIQYYAKIMDSNLDPKDFAPTTPPQPAVGQPTPHPKAKSDNGHQGMVGQQQGGIGHPVPVMQGGTH